MVQVIPDSHFFTDLNMLLEYLKTTKDTPEETIKYIIIGIKNTIANGYNVRRVEAVKHAERVENWIDEWMAIFPKGVKSGGKLLRSDKANCLVKMKSFLKNNDYPKELILEVTKAYVEERAMDDYMYTKCATYFIDKKGEGSELAALCENYEKPQDIKYSANRSNLI